MKTPFALVAIAACLAPTLWAEHDVSFEKELFITAPEIVRDADEAKPGGAWHFRSALGRVAGSVDVNAYAAAWFKTWAENESLAGVNDSFTKRSSVAAALQEAWTNNRIQLIAIVNRVDLARFPDGDTSKAPLTLGEGRFIYELRAANGDRLPFTIIFEYSVPFDRAGDTKAALKAWAKRWHALGRPGLTFTSTEYRQELTGLTNEYSGHGTLNQIRTNEFLVSPWELREFHHREAPAALLQAPVAITPAIAFNAEAGGGTKQLLNFLTGKTNDLIAGKHDSLLREFQGAVAPVASPNFKWKVDAAGNQALDRARFIFSFNTCNGCHAGDTRTLFQHIGVNTADGLSPFLTGPITLEKPLPPENNTSLTHDERDIRITILRTLSADVTAALAQDNLTQLIKGRANRVH